MGGQNETTIAGLRFHVNNGDVHIHDDGRSLKFTAKTKDFSEEIEYALRELEKKEGVLCLDGKSGVLCLCKKGKNLSAFLLPQMDIEKDLKRFAGSL